MMLMLSTYIEVEKLVVVESRVVLAEDLTLGPIGTSRGLGSWHGIWLVTGVPPPFLQPPKSSFRLAIVPMEPRLVVEHAMPLRILSHSHGLGIDRERLAGIA